VVRKAAANLEIPSLPWHPEAEEEWEEEEEEEEEEEGEEEGGVGVVVVTPRLN